MELAVVQPLLVMLSEMRLSAGGVAACVLENACLLSPCLWYPRGQTLAAGCLQEGLAVRRDAWNCGSPALAEGWLQSAGSKSLQRAQGGFQ